MAKKSITQVAPEHFGSYILLHITRCLVAADIKKSKKKCNQEASDVHLDAFRLAIICHLVAKILTIERHLGKHHSPSGGNL